RLLSEPVTGELHAVAGIASESDDHPIQLLDLLRHSGAPPARFTCYGERASGSPRDLARRRRIRSCAPPRALGARVIVNRYLHSRLRQQVVGDFESLLLPAGYPPQASEVGVVPMARREAGGGRAPLLILLPVRD